MTTGPSRELVRASLKRANEALRGAKILLEQNELYGATSRAYYAMFHAAQAILYSRGIKAKTHAGIRALFSEHVIKRGILSKEFLEALTDAYNLRQLSDYEIYAELSLERVKVLINKAERFVSGIEEILLSE